MSEKWLIGWLVCLTIISLGALFLADLSIEIHKQWKDYWKSFLADKFGGTP